jgi:hypothetical protein
MHGATSPLYQYAFMEWYSVKRSTEKCPSVLDILCYTFVLVLTTKNIKPGIFISAFKVPHLKKI